MSPEPRRRRPDVPSNEPKDAAGILSTWYGAGAIYVDKVAIFTGQGGLKKGTGEAEVTSLLADKQHDPAYVDYLTSSKPDSVIGRLLVSSAHMVGHFREDSDFFPILPGHKQIRAAVQTLEAWMRQRIGDHAFAQLRSFEGIQFVSMVPPGSELEIEVAGIRVGEALKGDRMVSADVKIVNIANEGKPAAIINGLVIETRKEVTYSHNSSLTADQMMEGVAQTAGLVSGVMSAESTTRVPLFVNIGPTRFLQEVASGLPVVYEVEVESVEAESKEPSEFNASAKITFGGGTRIGTSEGVRAMVLPKTSVDKLYEKAVDAVSAYREQALGDS